MKKTKLISFSEKITLRADQKNWRQRVETLKQNREHIEQLFRGTEKKLTQISNDIGQDLEKTSSREKYINQQLDGLINDLRSSHDKLAKAKVFINKCFFIHKTIGNIHESNIGHSRENDATWRNQSRTGHNQKRNGGAGSSHFRWKANSTGPGLIFVIS